MLIEESALKDEVAKIDDTLVELQNTKMRIEAKLEAAGSLRSLLYETGKPLESAVLEALRLLGFTAENYQEGDSEFDAIFVDPEGKRLIGEAEGKNDKAVNIDKPRPTGKEY